MKKRKEVHSEDTCFVAERQYQRMIENVNQGKVDKDEIVAAMTAINQAHYLAMKENKRYLLK
jgi:hypothetical protein